MVSSGLVEDVDQEDLFAAALALPATERFAYVRRACRADLDQLTRLTDLLDAFGDATTFVRNDELGAWPEACHVGPYHLIRELGEGGCGIAYLAEQTAPVKRQVAVKIIKPGMDTRAVIARFEAERQMLALLDHPNIAKVFDAGTTAEGRPYFVMELVRGIQITEFCAQSCLTVEERLVLFVQVCQAIQHAHQKGIIHRDIKPSNALVTMHDGLPLAKVIDFGIAKATNGRLIDQPLHTSADQLIGTPAYISPEQTEPTQVAVDTRSDIYSLGVLLYELLTGHTPFDAHELMQASIERLRTRIRTEEPLRPSKRLRSMENELLALVSIRRGVTGAKLVRQVQDDLDWIVMRCLEKESHRRYQTVNELTADLDRYLRFEPVRARPPSLSYAVRKFARRNRVAFVSAFAAIVFVLFITTFAIVMAVQAEKIATERDQAERERLRAQKVSNVVLNVFAMADPFRSLGSEINGSALLDQTAKSIQLELEDQPVPRARLLQAIGGAYIRRGEFRASIAYLKAAAPVLRKIRGAESEAIRAIVDLSAAFRESGDLRGAQRALADAERLAESALLQRSTAYASLLLNRGRTYVREGRISDARADFEMSLLLFQELVGAKSFQVAEVLTDLTVTHIWTDDLRQAEETAREAIRIFDVTVPSMYPDRVTTELNLAEALYLQNRLEEAAALIVDALRKNIELFGHNSAAVIDTLDKLAIVRYAQRRFHDAQGLSREAVAASHVTNGERHPVTAYVAMTLARTLAEREKYLEAEAILRQALGILTTTLPPDHQYTASAEYFLGEVLLATNRPREAEAILTASMNRWTRSGAPSWRAMRSASALGEAIYRQGRTAEGSKLLSDSHRELSADSKAELAAKDKARERANRYLGKSAL